MTIHEIALLLAKVDILFKHLESSLSEVLHKNSYSSSNTIQYIIRQIREICVL